MIKRCYFLILFVYFQLWSTFHEPEQVEKAFNRSFDNLNLGYIDLYLIHYPVAYKRVLLNIRLPSDDVNAFNPFPVDKDGKNGVKCTASMLANQPDLFLTILIENIFLNKPITLCNTAFFFTFEAEKKT